MSLNDDARALGQASGRHKASNLSKKGARALKREGKACWELMSISLTDTSFTKLWGTFE